MPTSEPRRPAMVGTRHRHELLKIFRSALHRVAGETAVSRWLSRDGNRADFSAVVAIGKAAPAMMLGARERLETGNLPGLVITRHGHADPRLDAIPGVLQIESGHPVPDETSLEAGQQLLDFLAAAPPDRPVLFLLSGGTSSLVESLPRERTLSDLRRLNEWLLSSGLDIRAMNRLRSRMSRIKAGQLCSCLEGRPATVLLISDVPGDDPAFVGSGLLHPPSFGSVPAELPAAVAGLLNSDPLPMGPPCADHHLVAVNADAVAAAMARARQLGYQAYAVADSLQGDAAAAGRAFARYLQQAPAGIHVMGGETTVRLPASPGRGGRNQHLALAAAGEIEGRKDILILAAGTDGSDGRSEDAGALVDGDTWQRARDAGLDPRLSLREADSGNLLEATGDLVHTGPTGTNVMDLLIGLRL